MLSISSVETGEKYQNGRNLGLNTRSDVTAIYPRYTRTFTLNDHPAAFYIQPTLSRIRPGGSLAGNDRASGIGDTAAALAYWPYVNSQERRYLTLSGFLVAPTGKYDSNKLINLGQNRYSAALQMAYQAPLTDQLDLMVSADTQWFGENDDYRLTHQKFEQDLLYSAQLSLMYNINSTWMAALSLYHNQGGEGQLNGVDQNDKIDRKRYQLALSKVMPTGKWIFQYGKDANTENGFIEERKAFLRYLIPLK